MKNKDIIFFDLDGTLTDPKTGIVKGVVYALKSFGITVEDTDTLTKFIGPPLKSSFMEFYGFSEDAAERACAKYREYYETQGIYENYLFDGVREMLRTLKKSGKTIVLATSKPLIFARQVLDNFNLTGFFDYIGGSNIKEGIETKTDVLENILENNNYDIERCIMVGDRKFDIEGAKNVGMKSAGVLFGYGSEEELQAALADYIIQNVEELTEFLMSEEYI